MSFQTKIYRQYTAGFPGDVFRDGPLRAKPAIIASATLGADPGASTNRFSRAFGYFSEVPGMGTAPNSTNPALEMEVAVGAPIFFGILFQPKQHALAGGSGGTLSPSLDLPQYITAEFCDMGILVGELFNETTAAKTSNYGDGICYVPNTITPANNPEALPYGALVSYPAGGAVPAGMIAIPNARVTNLVTYAASALGALVSSYTSIQLTQ